MRKSILALSAIALLGLPMAAQINVTLPQNSGVSSVDVTVIPIATLVNPRDTNAVAPTTSSVAVKNNALEVQLSDLASRYLINLTPKVPEGVQPQAFFLFAAPGEQIDVDVTSLEPMAVSMSGTPLVEAITSLNALAAPLEAEAEILQATEDTTGRMQELIDQYEKIFTDFVAANPTNDGAVYAWLNISDPESAVELFPTISAPQAILYPLAQKQYERMQKQVERKRAQDAMKGRPAPDFSLPDLEGNALTLSSLRGKWVILDFWGSWCPWCIKGFPALKEAYQMYAGKLEVVGVDCGDTPEAWKAAVEKYSLPWLNVYGDGSDITSLYGVQAYPTKVLISPEGNVVTVVTGEDPSFFTTLSQYLN